MEKISIAIMLLLFSVGASLFTAQNINIIPRPQEIQTNGEQFTLNTDTKVRFDKSSFPEIGLFIEQLRKVTGFPLPVTKSDRGNTIDFVIDPKLQLPSDEGYFLNVGQSGIQILAKIGTGLFYGAESLRQLLPVQFESEIPVKNVIWNVPGVQIKDYPRYYWRGFMMDVSRTFYGVDVVKKYLDLMALYKLNTFHWHLTDDQGWRIEIKKYPKLTSTVATVFDPSEHQPAKRSGFYTQEQVKEIVAYAKARHITIVPEIDVPGHSWPTLLVYPELGVNNNHVPPYIFPFVSSWKFWGNQFTPNTLDPTNEKVYAFLKNVFKELADLFPGEYIHFGGDEIQFKFWEKEPHVLAFMRAHNLATPKELESYFVRRVSKMIVDLGKKPMGWNDILADKQNLPKETAVMSWLGEAGVKEAADARLYTVATPYSRLYLDITQADRNDGTPADLAYSNINSIDRIYDYDPSQGLNNDQVKYMLGVQANMWTALAQDLKDMNVQVFPRLLALSEIAWTLPENKDFNGFKKRLNQNEQRLTELKVDYYHPGGYIFGQWTPKDIQEDYKELRFDVTPKVYTTGRAVAGFFFTSGKNFLEIDGVKLLKNGQVIAEDDHHSLADTFRGTNKIKPFYYNLEVKNYDPKAKYEIVAEVRGQNGTDSYGNFTFNLDPDSDFKVVEKE